MEILLLIGKLIAWLVYLGFTFLTQEIFRASRTYIGKVLILLAQIMAMTAMVSPYWMESWEDGLRSQLVAVLVLWLMIWTIGYFQHKKIVKTSKTLRRSTSKEN